MKLLAIAVMVLTLVLAVIAGVSIYTWGYRSSASASSYDGYEPALREWFALSRVQVTKVKHLAGPLYAIRYRSKRNPTKQYCPMADVSTKYKGGSQDFDNFWWTAGWAGFTGKGVENYICDF